MYIIDIRYINGSMSINLENWIECRPTKTDMRRVYKLAVDSDRDYNTKSLDNIANYIRDNQDSRNKTIKALAEVFNVPFGLNKEVPKKERKKDLVIPEHSHIEYGRYLLAVYADIYTYKGMRYGIYKSTDKRADNYYILVECSTSCKIDGSKDKNYLIGRIVDTYDMAVNAVSRMQARIDYVQNIKSGEAYKDIAQSIDTVTTLYNKNIITKEAYIDTISVFSKLTARRAA